MVTPPRTPHRAQLPPQPAGGQQEQDVLSSSQTAPLLTPPPSSGNASAKPPSILLPPPQVPQAIRQLLELSIELFHGFVDRAESTGNSDVSFRKGCVLLPGRGRLLTDCLC